MRFEADGRSLLVHGSPRRINEYLCEDKPDPPSPASPPPRRHRLRLHPSAVRQDRRRHAGCHVGSSGKPKDGAPRACWALIEATPDNVTVEFRRVTYDVEAVAGAIGASELPDEFATQLREARGCSAKVWA